jgi:hypothetical protein
MYIVRYDKAKHIATYDKASHEVYAQIACAAEIPAAEVQARLEKGLSVRTPFSTYNAITYRQAVLLRLAEHGYDRLLIPGDDEVIAAGERYDVGPNDCALQIIDNHQSEQAS